MKNNNFEEIRINEPFHILRKNKDKTLWKKERDGGLLIFFHAEKFWCNPPTDTKMETNAINAINKYGIEYVSIY